MCSFVENCKLNTHFGRLRTIRTIALFCLLLAPQALATESEEALIAAARVSEHALLLEENSFNYQDFGAKAKALALAPAPTEKTVEYLWTVLARTKVARINGVNSLGFFSTEGLKYLFKRGSTSLKSRIAQKISSTMAQIVEEEKFSGPFVKYVSELAATAYRPGRDKRLSHALAQFFQKAESSVAYVADQTLNHYNIESFNPPFMVQMKTKDPDLFVAYEEYDMRTFLEPNNLGWRINLGDFELVNSTIAKCLFYPDPKIQTKALQAVLWLLEEKRLEPIDVHLINIVRESTTKDPVMLDLLEKIRARLANENIDTDYAEKAKESLKKGFRDFMAFIRSKSDGSFLAERSMTLDLEFAGLHIAAESASDPETITLVAELAVTLKDKGILNIENDKKSPYREDFLKHVESLAQRAKTAGYSQPAQIFDDILEQARIKYCDNVVAFPGPRKPPSKP